MKSVRGGFLLFEREKYFDISLLHRLEIQQKWTASQPFQMKAMKNVKHKKKQKRRQALNRA